jgi:hypothetical protein
MPRLLCFRRDIPGASEPVWTLRNIEDLLYQRKIESLSLGRSSRNLVVVATEMFRLPVNLREVREIEIATI